MRDERDFHDDSTDLLKDLFDQHESFDETRQASRAGTGTAIYCRRSQADARDVSIGRQVAVCVDYCRRVGLTVDESLIFIDRNCTGATLEGRVSFHALMAKVRDRVVGTVVGEGIDRFTRDVLDAVRTKRELEESQTELHIAGRGPVNLEEMTIFALQAQKERERTAALTFAGNRNAAAKGAYIGKRRHYGYDSHPAEGAWTINPFEADVLRQAARHYDETGTTVHAVAKRLNEHGIRTASGKPWASNYLFNCAGTGALQCRLLVGEHVRFKKSDDPVVISLPQLAILDRELFDRINAKYRPKPGTRSPPIEAERELFTHIAFCGHCGSPISKKQFDYGDWRISCSRTHRFEGCAETTTYRSTFVERRMLLTIRDEILREDNLADRNEQRRKEWEELHRALEPRRTALLRRWQELELWIADQLAPAEAMRMIDRTILADAELEQHKLDQALKAIGLPPPLEIGEPEAAELRSAVAGLLLRMPILAETDEDKWLLARLRTLVPRITLASSPGGDGYRVRCLLGIADGPEPVAEGIDPTPARWLEHDVACTVGRMKTPEVVLAHHEAAAEGAFRITDADWELVGHLFEPVRRRIAERRAVAEGLVMLASTGLPARLLPEPYHLVATRLSLVRKTGIWPAMFDILAEAGSTRIEGLDRDRFDRWPGRRRMMMAESLPGP